MYVKKIEGLWCLMKGCEIVEAYDTKQEAELAHFDATRNWKSMWDQEHKE